MPYATDHWVITVGGDSWTSTETWQFGVRATANGVPVAADQQLLANALAAPTQTMFSSTAFKMYQTNRLMWVKAALVDAAEGHYVFPGAPGLYTYPSPVAGTSSTYAPCPQQTLAVTTLTPVARGRASKGRFYLPPGCWQVQTDGRITAAEADSIETAVRTWLLAINATTQVGDVAVFSKLGNGTTNLINAVGVGRVLDTMRSRRRSLAEGRTPLVL
jgi:hypothetical protein